jgi:DNA-binding transcriptional ArsR family regulator
MSDEIPGLPSILSLDRMIHEPSRLAILTVLAAAEEVEFLFLQRVTGLSKGNLSIQAQKLEGAGLIAIRKFFRGRRPVTSFQLTDAGQNALRAYHFQLRQVLPKEETR